MRSASLIKARAGQVAAAVVMAAAGLPAAASEALANQHACLACHAVDQKVVGPSFVEVAKRYGSGPEAVEKLAKSIRMGTKGAWGNMDMPAQPQLTPAQAQQLATWVLNRKP